MANFLFGNAYAQNTHPQSVSTNTVTNSQAQAETPAVQPQNPLGSPLFLLVMLGIFYFVLFRPQKKKMEQEQKLAASLGKGDEIYTKSGILGTIVGTTDKIITLEVAEGVKFKILRSQIAGKSEKLFEKKEAAPAKVTPKKA